VSWPRQTSSTPSATNLHGGTGTGKTHCASASPRAVIPCPRPGRFFNLVIWSPARDRRRPPAERRAGPGRRNCCAYDLSSSTNSAICVQPGPAESCLFQMISKLLLRTPSICGSPTTSHLADWTRSSGRQDDHPAMLGPPTIMRHHRDRQHQLAPSKTAALTKTLRGPPSGLSTCGCHRDSHALRSAQRRGALRYGRGSLLCNYEVSPSITSRGVAIGRGKGVAVGANFDTRYHNRSPHRAHCCPPTLLLIAWSPWSARTAQGPARDWSRRASARLCHLLNRRLAFAHGMRHGAGGAYTTLFPATESGQPDRGGGPMPWRARRCFVPILIPKTRACGPVGGSSIRTSAERRAGHFRQRLGTGVDSISPPRRLPIGHDRTGFEQLGALHGGCRPSTALSTNLLMKGRRCIVPRRAKLWRKRPAREKSSPRL